MKNKLTLWYDEEADYLELTFKKSKDSYFNELQKDCFEIKETTTDEIIGFAIFNFTHRKEKFLDIPFSLPPRTI